VACGVKHAPLWSRRVDNRLSAPQQQREHVTERSRTHQPGNLMEEDGKCNED